MAQIPAITPKVDLPSSIERERERALEASREQHHIYIFREGPSNGAPQAQELSPWRVVERGLTTTVAVFPPRSNQGRASTAMLD